MGYPSCIALGDGVQAIGKPGHVFYEPTHMHQGYPAITIFQTLNSWKKNEANASHVTVRGMVIRGRQPKSDGGMRAAVAFGNCDTCASIENDLEGTAGIGISFGGSAANGNHALNVLSYRDKIRNHTAAAIALVNVDGAIVANADIRDPGRRWIPADQRDPGGVSGIDIETNNTDDCARNIKIFNNYIGYGHAKPGTYGSGILAQNVYGTPCSGGLISANNVIDGFEGAMSDRTWGLSNGLFFVGHWEGGRSINDRIIHGRQNGIQAYSLRGMTFEDIWIVSSGGGGNAASISLAVEEHLQTRARLP